MTFQFPEPLTPGDTVAVVSPSGPVLPEHLAFGIQTLESWGLRVRLYEPYERSDHGYLAGEDDHRAEQLATALADPDVKAIFFARGGYGSMRLLDSVEYHPKLLVGFSDITAIHLAFATRGIATLHGPVVKSFGSQKADLPALKDAVFGGRDDLNMQGETAIKGKTDGVIVGGNLSLVQALAGTSSMPRLQNAILCLEDVGEADYRLDRLLVSLRQTLADNPPVGLVLGHFTNCGGVYVNESEINNLLTKLAREFDVPTIIDAPFGHAHRNWPLPIGAPATLDATAGTLTLHRDIT